MSDQPDHSHKAAFRVGVLMTSIMVLSFVLTWAKIIDANQLKEWVQQFGPAAPVVFVVAASILGALLIPGAVLSAAAGLIFNPFVGGLLGVTAALGTAFLASTFSKRVAGDAAEHLNSPRMRYIVGLLHRQPLRTVIIQRLTPGLPDGPFSHAFGAAGVKPLTVTLGSLLGAAPRAFSYALVGAGAGSQSGTTVAWGVAINIVVGIVGFTLFTQMIRRERRRSRQLS